MKTRIERISKDKLNKWITISNMFAKSVCPIETVIKQYNTLTAKNKADIKNEFSKYDEIRRKRIPKGETDDTYLDSVLVDTHIIATEYNIDPLTAIMCVNAPIRFDKKIMVN